MKKLLAIALGTLFLSTPTLSFALDKAKCDKALTNFEKLAGLPKTQKEVEACAAGKNGYTDKIIDCLGAAKPEADAGACLSP